MHGGKARREEWHGEVMLTTAWPCHDVLGDGRGCSGDAIMSRGGAGFQREASGWQGRTWSSISASMGTSLFSACKVFDRMAERKKNLNF